MPAYIVRKLLYGILVLWGVATLVFFLFTIVPGDPVRMMLGQRADEKDVQAIREELGLNQNIGKQYLDYLNDLSFISFYKNYSSNCNDAQQYASNVSGLKVMTIGETSVVLKAPYLRYSYQSKRPVGAILSEAFPNTLILAFVSITFAFIIGVLLGVLTAVVNSGFLNRLTLFVTTIGMSLPSFFAAILIAWLLGFVLHDVTGLEMTGSLFSVDDYGNGSYLDLKNLILPALTLGLRPLAVITELTRTTLLDVMSMDYIRTARAKGLKKWRVIGVHALRNAMTPVVTAVSGWFASLLAGAVFVEYVFDWKGIGVVIVDALDKFDFPVIMGAVLLIGVMLIVINIAVDIIYGVLDPRVRIK
ncbi:MAG: ABC transporter permease [Bacteroidales bacterium]|nr:ABC transporter permease [Bacteroidales bacterium]